MTKVLVIVAHADDEAIGCGGMLIKHQQQGDEIRIIYMTNGVDARQHDSNKQNIKDKRCIDIRRNSQQKACHFLNIKQSYNFDFPDNQMDQVPLIRVVKVIEEIISTYQPNLIYTHHGGDLNVDHRIVHQAVITACRPQPDTSVKSIFTFEVNSSTEWSNPTMGTDFIPNYFVDISKVVSEKNQLLQCYQQEMRAYPHSRSLQAIENLNRWRGNQVGLTSAEAFMLIRHIQS